jgi:hypothetical protein
VKICVLGNSQAACLKAAWDVPKNRPPRHELTFFAAFGMSLGNLAVDGERLVPSTKALRRHLEYTAGLGEVDGPAYDAFLICGAGFGLRPIDARLSRQLVGALSSDLLRTSLAYSLASKVRQITDAPIYIMHAPLLDERTAGRARFEVLSYGDYFPLLKQAVDIPMADLLKQPEQTITRGHYTKLEFSKDAVRLAVKGGGEGIQHKDEDYNHMNADYGAVRLKDFFERLAPA